MTRMPVGPPSQNIIFRLVMQALRYTARQVATSTRLLAAADPACCLANAPLAQQAVMQQPWGQQRCWSSGNTDSQGSAPLTGETYSAASLVPEAELAVIRQRIFGTHIGNNLSSGRKVLRQRLCGDRVANYYMKPIQDPLMVDLDAELRRAKLDKLRRRGKGPPKKGQGKRAGKKK